MNKELKIVLELLKFDKIDSDQVLTEQNVNWMSILGFLTYHKVAGLAYEKIKKIGVRSFDYPIYISTYMINQAQKIRAEEQNRWINLISNELIKANIKHAFLKGSVLNNTLYNHGSRISNDIDILINKKSITKVTKILINLGFVQGKYNYTTKTIKKFTKEEKSKSILTRGETAPFVLKTDNPFIETIDVDLNFSIDWQPSNTKIVKDFLDQSLLISKNDGQKIYSLNTYSNFLQLCSHFYKDSAIIDILKKRKIIDLYKIVDIYYFIKKYFDEINFDYLFSQIKKYNLEKHVYFTLIYVTKLFPDCKNNAITELIKKTKQKNVLNIIHAQYDNLSLKTNISIGNRVSSYDVIKKYKEKI